jgi:hypothetical protein
MSTNTLYGRMPHNQPPPHQQPIGLPGTKQYEPKTDQSFNHGELIRGFPTNSYNVFEVVGFGAFHGATHSTFHVKKHPTYMSLH